MDTEKERVIHDVVPESHMGLTLLAVARETPIPSPQFLAPPMLSFVRIVMGQYHGWQVSDFRAKTYLMRNWTSAESVSISLLLASSPMVIFTPSLTKSLSWKGATVEYTSHVLNAGCEFGFVLILHTFNVGSFFCFSFSLASLSTVDPFKSYFLCTWCKTILSGITSSDFSPSGGHWRRSSSHTCSSQHCPPLAWCT